MIELTREQLEKRLEEAEDIANQLMTTGLRMVDTAKSLVKTFMERERTIYSLLEDAEKKTAQVQAELKVFTDERERHATHGRVSVEDSPNYTSCPCTGKELEDECARYGCAYCAIGIRSRFRSGNHPLRVRNRELKAELDAALKRASEAEEALVVATGLTLAVAMNQKEG